MVICSSQTISALLGLLFVLVIIAAISRATTATSPTILAMVPKRFLGLSSVILVATASGVVLICFTIYSFGSRVWRDIVHLLL